MEVQSAETDKLHEALQGMEEKHQSTLKTKHEEYKKELSTAQSEVKSYSQD